MALKDSGLNGVEDLVGKIVAFEEPHSTSGFVLPAGTLVQRGYRLRELDAPAQGGVPSLVDAPLTAPRELAQDLVFADARRRLQRDIVILISRSSTLRKAILPWRSSWSLNT